MKAFKKMIVICLVLVFSILCLTNWALPKGKKNFTLVIRMMGIQDTWFRENIIPPFEKQHDAGITVVAFDKFWDLEVMLALEKDSGRHTIGLVKTPLEMTRSLQKFMIPYDDVMSANDLQTLKAQYDPQAVKLGTIDGKLYYLPRKLETRMMTYLKSKVDEAVKGWKQFEADINAAL